MNTAAARLSPAEETRLEHLARRRAKAKLGWYLHAAVYVAVNLGLIALSVASGRHWAAFPLLGWGLGLFFHGMAVWVFAPGNPLMGRMVERERPGCVPRAAIRGEAPLPSKIGLQRPWDGRRQLLKR